MFIQVRVKHFYMRDFSTSILTWASFFIRTSIITWVSVWYQSCWKIFVTASWKVFLFVLLPVESLSIPMQHLQTLPVIIVISFFNLTYFDCWSWHLLVHLSLLTLFNSELGGYWKKIQKYKSESPLQVTSISLYP